MSRWRRTKPVEPREARAQKGRIAPQIRLDGPKPFGAKRHRNARQYLTVGDRVYHYGQWGTVTKMRRHRGIARALVHFDDETYQRTTRHHWFEVRNLRPMMKI